MPVPVLTDEQRDAMWYPSPSRLQSVSVPAHHWSKRVYDPLLWMPYHEDAPGMSRDESLAAVRLNKLSRQRHYLIPEILQRFILDADTGKMYLNLEDPVNLHMAKSTEEMRNAIDFGEVPTPRISLAGSKAHPVARYNLTLGPWGIRGAKGSRKNSSASVMWVHAVLLGLYKPLDDEEYIFCLRSRRDEDGYILDTRAPWLYRANNINVTVREAKHSAAGMAQYLKLPNYMPTKKFPGFEGFGRYNRSEEAIRAARDSDSYT